MNKKKSAFSYVELIISMSLIVMVVMLATPFLTKSVRETSGGSGSFICFVGRNGNLYQITKYKYYKDNIEKEDVTGPEKVDYCIFERPKNVFRQYEITLVGGGASYGNSKPGAHGQVSSFSSYLERSFDEDNEIKIYKCETPATLTENNNDFRQYSKCVGLGGPFYNPSDTSKKLTDEKQAYHANATMEFYYAFINKYVQFNTKRNASSTVLSYASSIPSDTLVPVCSHVLDSSLTYSSTAEKNTIYKNNCKLCSGAVNLTNQDSINAAKNCLAKINTKITNKNFKNYTTKSQVMGHPTYFEEKTKDGYIINDSDNHIGKPGFETTTVTCGIGTGAGGESNKLGCIDPTETSTTLPQETKESCGCGGNSTITNAKGGAIIIKW